MKRKVYTKQMNKLKIQNAIKTESDVNGDTDRRHDIGNDNAEIKSEIPDSSLHCLDNTRSRISSTKVIALPNVNVLMDGSSRVALKQNEHDHFQGVVNNDTNKWQSSAQLSFSQPSVHPENHSAQQEDVHSESASEEMPKLIALKTRRAEKDSQSVVSLVSDRTSLDGSRSVEDRASFAEHGNFATQPIRAQSTHLELLNPVLLHGKKQEQSEDTGDSINSESYLYSDQMSGWNPANDRYVEFGWRCQNLYPTDALSSMSNTSNNNAVPPSSNTADDARYDDIDYRYDQAYLSDASSTKVMVVNGRRRRKRVQTPGQRTAANMRERRRMCHLNVAFDRLKEHLPSVKDKKKLSRIQTLKAAIYYIHLLRDSLKLC